MWGLDGGFPGMSSAFGAVQVKREVWIGERGLRVRRVGGRNHRRITLRFCVAREVSQHEELQVRLVSDRAEDSSRFDRL